MLPPSSAEIERNISQIHQKLDEYRDKEINLKERIFNLCNGIYEDVKIRQPAEERDSIRNELNELSKQLTNTYHSIQTVHLMVETYIINTITNTAKIKGMQEHLERKFEYVYKRHTTNVWKVYYDLGMQCNIPAIA